MKSLKSTYRRSLAIFAVINIAVFWMTIISPTDFQNWRNMFEITIKDVLFVAFPPILTLVLSGFFSATTKARFVYWRYKNPMPGSRAFTVHMIADHRIDPKSLKEKYGSLPTNPEDQNRLWYKIYRQVESDIRIQDSHRDWLFARDLTAYSVIFLIIFSAFTILSDSNWKIKLIYLSIIIIQYISISISARNYGQRFVCNVLAIASQLDSDIE